MVPPVCGTCSYILSIPDAVTDNVARLLTEYRALDLEDLLMERELNLQALNELLAPQAGSAVPLSQEQQPQQASDWVARAFFKQGPVGDAVKYGSYVSIPAVVACTNKNQEIPTLPLEDERVERASTEARVFWMLPLPLPRVLLRRLPPRFPRLVP